jgi:predicted O-methyltransferase YrrM
METLAEQSVRYNAKNDAAYGTALIFEREVHDEIRWGGDYVFCRKWRALGGKIYIDPAMRFEHSGMETWTGSVGQWLRARAGIGLQSGLAAIAQGRDDIADHVDLFDAWGNRFAASPVLMSSLAMLAREAKGPILECGGGLSTLVMAAANPNVELHTLEDSPIFADHLRLSLDRYGVGKNVIIHCQLLRDGWYNTDTLTAYPRHHWALAFLDGPRRGDGERSTALERVDLSQAVIIADDVQQDGGVADMIERLEPTHDILVVKDSERRSFAIGRPKTQAQSEAA